jgi:hypothetical protein
MASVLLFLCSKNTLLAFVAGATSVGVNTGFTDIPAIDARTGRSIRRNVKTAGTLATAEQ